MEEPRVSVRRQEFICRADDGKFNPLSPHDALKHHFTSLKTGVLQ